jgi:hypothetical protein
MKVIFLALSFIAKQFALGALSGFLLVLAMYFIVKFLKKNLSK